MSRIRSNVSPAVGATFTLMMVYLGFSQLTAGQVVMNAPMYLASPQTITPTADGGMQWLHDASVLKDLALVAEQRDEMRKLQAEFQKSQQGMMAELAKISGDAEKQREWNKRYQEAQAAHHALLKELLLPHQQDRLRQVSRQMQVQMYGGTAGAMSNGMLAQELEISDEQKKKLAEIQSKLQEQLAKKTAELREAAKKESLAVLTHRQREKFNELVGEKFERKSSDWQEHFEEQKKAAVENGN